MNSVLTFPHSAATCSAREAVAQARRHPGIRHFEGPAQNKPWHRACDQQLRELYFSHRRETPWPHVDLDRPGAPPALAAVGPAGQCLTAIRPV